MLTNESDLDIVSKVTERSTLNSSEILTWSFGMLQLIFRVVSR